MSVLSAQAAGVRRRRRWLFRDLDVSVSPGDVVAIVGPPGSGRTTVLLALAQRFRLSAGRVDLTGTAALGYVPGVSEPESVLTVAEHVRERVLLTGRRPGGEVAWHGLDPGARGWELSPYERQVLGLVLARMAAPQVVALDGVDEGLDAAEREALWRLIGDAAAQGVAVLVTAREVDEARVSTVVRLGGSGRVVSADAVAVRGIPDAGAVAQFTADATEEWRAETAPRQQPSADEPEAEEPAVTVPVAEQREKAGQPEVTEPVANDREAAEEPGVPEPVADQPEVTEPEAKGREAAEEPGVPEPVAERREAAEPSKVTEPVAKDQERAEVPRAEEREAAPPSAARTPQESKETQEHHQEQGGEQK